MGHPFLRAHRFTSRAWPRAIAGLALVALACAPHLARADDAGSSDDSATPADASPGAAAMAPPEENARAGCSIECDRAPGAGTTTSAGVFTLGLTALWLSRRRGRRQRREGERRE